jgi:hypothetical protein
MFMKGCELREAYPVVPIADRHGLSIGMTSVAGQALIGVYADAESVPDADEFAADIARELDVLRSLPAPPSARSRLQPVSV